jgi:hypothetical protein
MKKLLALILNFFKSLFGFKTEPKKTSGGSVEIKPSAPVYETPVNDRLEDFKHADDVLVEAPFIEATAEIVIEKPAKRKRPKKAKKVVAEETPTTEAPAPVKKKRPSKKKKSE